MDGTGGTGVPVHGGELIYPGLQINKLGMQLPAVQIHFCFIAKAALLKIKGEMSILDLAFF